MGQFFYFVTSKTGALIQAGQLDQLGLGSLFPEGVEQMQIASSRYGKGVLLWGHIHSKSEQSNRVRSGELSVDDFDVVCPVESPLPDSYFVVLAESENLPTENDLRRSEFLEQSDFVKLGDGEAWAMPRLRDVEGNVTLPAIDSLFADGGKKVVRRFEKLDKFGGLLAKQYEAIAQASETAAPGTEEHAKRLAELMAPDEPIKTPRLLEAIVEALSANYRVGKAEIELLELLTPAARMECWSAMIGRIAELRMLQAMQWEKKRTEAKSFLEQVENVGAGIPAEPSPDTGGGEALASAQQ